MFTAARRRPRRSAAALDFEPPHVSRARRDREREGHPEPEVVERPRPNQALTEVELLAECGRHVCESHLVRFVGRQRIPLPGYQPNALNALCIDVNRDIFGRFTDLPGHESGGEKSGAGTTCGGDAIASPMRRRDVLRRGPYFFMCS